MARRLTQFQMRPLAWSIIFGLYVFLRLLSKSLALWSTYGVLKEYF